MCYERHPESVRTVPWLRPAGCDPVSGRSGNLFFWPSPSCVLGHSTSLNIAPKIVPFLCFRPPDNVQNPALLVFYATRHRSKSCPSSVLGHPKKVPAEKHKKGKKKMSTRIRPKIVVFQLKILSFLCFTQIGTAQGP